jgi:hypothetical protein
LWKASVLPTLSYINMHLITLFTSLPALIWWVRIKDYALFLLTFALY